MEQDSFSPCTGDIAVAISHQTSGESGASADVVIRVRASVVQIQIEHTCVAAIVPIATTARETTINNPVPKLLFFILLYPSTK
jgi:hypothetical protein